jgi:hypothetical protein
MSQKTNIVITVLVIVAALAACVYISQKSSAKENMTSDAVMELPASIRNTETNEQTSAVISIKMTDEIRKKLMTHLNPFN